MSLGMLCIAPIMLNSRYHCIPVRRSTIEASCIPIGEDILLRIKSVTIGNNAVAGIDWPMSKIGINAFASFCLLAIAIPARSVQPRAMRYAASNLRRDEAVEY